MVLGDASATVLMFDELAEHRRQIADRLADQSVLTKWLLRLDSLLWLGECCA
jgi:hypothetical protein